MLVALAVTGLIWNGQGAGAFNWRETLDASQEAFKGFMPEGWREWPSYRACREGKVNAKGQSDGSTW
jgi:hypothetical protein